MYCGVKTNLVNFQLEVARLFENLLTLSKLWAFRNGKSIKNRHPDSLLESNVCFETVELKTIISNSSTMNQHIFSILAQKKWKIESNINVRGNCAASYNCHCPPINCHGQRKDPEQQSSFFVRWGKYFGFYRLQHFFLCYLQQHLRKKFYLLTAFLVYLLAKETIWAHLLVTSLLFFDATFLAMEKLRPLQQQQMFEFLKYSNFCQRQAAVT